MLKDVIYPPMYRKFVREVHYMRKYNGFGISQALLSDLKQKNIRYIEIVYTDNKGFTKVYIATLRQYLQSMFHFKNPLLEFDMQSFVEMSDIIRSDLR